MTGSPPLARGTHERVPEEDEPARLTPARAGNTRAPQPRVPEMTAHPRSRGEHVSCELSGDMRTGSPPLARGTHSTRRGAVRGLRLTPARAGNTEEAAQQVMDLLAHPRSRGEHWCRPSFVPCLAGSPPLARGTPVGGEYRCYISRLTPARAGNTVKRDATIDLSTAHPRSRGEHQRSSHRSLTSSGSPPLARGTRLER